MPPNPHDEELFELREELREWLAMPRTIRVLARVRSAESASVQELASVAGFVVTPEVRIRVLAGYIDGLRAALRLVTELGA